MLLCVSCICGVPAVVMYTDLCPSGAQCQI